MDKFFKWIRLPQEYCLYLLGFLITFLYPFFETGREAFGEGTFQWDFILQRWLFFLPFALAVIVHNFFLAPILIEKRWPLTYMLALILLLGCFFLYDRSRYRIPRRPSIMELSSHHHHGPMDAPPLPELQAPPSNDARQRELPPPRRRGNILINLLVVFLYFGCNVAIKLHFRRQKETERMEELEKIHLQQELAQLKAQMSPHFFMNSLNNIHGMMDIDTEKAQAMILELSGMMRYVLYESTSVTIPLSREIAFLRNYISLMLIRYTKDTVDIQCRFPSEEEASFVNIPPLVFINFIENAFKHGVGHHGKSFVDISMQVDTDILTFHCQNTICRKEKRDAYGGVGLTNIRKRLDILYADKYTLDIGEKEDKYCVTLTIPIHGTYQMYNSR